MKRDTLSIKALNSKASSSKTRNKNARNVKLFAAQALAIPLVTGSLLLPHQASAQIGFYVVPSVSVARVKDDNLFFSAENEVEDDLTRLTPALEIGYDSTRFSWRGNYTMDAERYEENTQLDSNNTRSLADLEFEYLPSQRMTIGAGASFLQTETPVDLAIATGFPAGRFDAERLTVSPFVEYGFSASTTGRLEYLYTTDEIDNGVSSDSSEVAARVEHALSAENLVTGGYRFRTYEFNDQDGTDSHTPWIGWTHRFTSETQFISEVGPRIDEDETELYLLLSLRHNYERGQAEIAYTIDENTSIGDIGRIENRTVSANVTHSFTDNLTMSLTANVGEVIYYDLTSDLRQAGFDIRYRVFDWAAVFAGVTHNYQSSGFLEVEGREIGRNTFILGLTLAYPSRRPLPDENN